MAPPSDLNVIDITVFADGEYFVIAGGYQYQDFYGTPLGYIGEYKLSITEEVPVTGTAGDDWLAVTALDDSFAIRGDAGRDMISFSGLAQGINLVSGEEAVNGFGYKIYEANHNMRFLYDRNMIDRNAVLDDLRLIEVEAVTGTGFADTFRGGVREDWFRGAGGADVFYGSDGADTYDGGAGFDVLDYMDRWNIDFDAEGVNVSLLRGRGWAGDAAGDRFTGIEGLSGAAGNDTLTGDHGNNRLSGVTGDDILTGLGGDDFIYGGLGTDTAVFGYDRDQYEIAGDAARAVVTYIGTGAGDGADTLLSVEQLQFADALVIL